MLALIAAGLSNGQIARELFVSEGDRQDAHQPHLRQGRRADRAQAVHYAYQQGLAQPKA